MGCVYSISCPINKNVVYIGQTTRDFESRMIEQFKYPANLELKDFMQNLKDLNLFPVCQILEISNDKYKLFELERKWIAHYENIGIRLFNRPTGIAAKYNFKLITGFTQSILF